VLIAATLGLATQLLVANEGKRGACSRRSRPARSDRSVAGAAVAWRASACRPATMFRTGRTTRSSCRRPRTCIRALRHRCRRGIADTRTVRRPSSAAAGRAQRAAPLPMSDHWRALRRAQGPPRRLTLPRGSRASDIQNYRATEAAGCESRELGVFPL